jgi:hypothetical protein
MTPTEIRARRKQLEEQADSARRAYYPAHQAHAAAKADLSAAKGARTQALVDEAKGLGADVPAAIEREAAAETAVADATARQDAVHRAREEAERHVKEFLAKHFELFAEDAMKLTKRAEDGLHKANRAILLAEGLWKDAQAAWAPLCGATSIAGVPPFPLAGSSPLPARPPAVSVESKEDEAA